MSDDVQALVLLQAENEAQENLHKWQIAERRFLATAQAAEVLEAEVVRLQAVNAEMMESLKRAYDDIYYDHLEEETKYLIETAIAKAGGLK